jgi:hypothetical protein
MFQLKVKKMSLSVKKRLYSTAISCLVLLYIESCSATYSIDDGILFRLNFQPSPETSATAASSKGISSEPSAVPADESLLGNKGKFLHSLNVRVPVGVVVFYLGDERLGP